MKQSPPQTAKVYLFANYRLDSKQKLLFCENSVVPIGQKAYECLLLLVENAPNLVLKETFFDQIWGESFVEDGVLAVNISFLRKTFGETKGKSQFIETFSRKGYRFLPKVEIETTEIEEEFPSFISVLEGELAAKPTIRSESAPIAQFSEVKIEQPIEVSNSFQSEIVEKRGWVSRFKVVEFGILAIVAITGILFLYQRYTNVPAPRTPRKISVAIFPFVNSSGNKELNYLSLSLADSLNYSLNPISQARTVPTSTIKRFAEIDYKPVDEGKNLGVENIVTGTFHTEKDKIIVEVQITRIADVSQTVQRKMFEAPITDLAAIRSAIYKFLIGNLNLNRTNEELLEIQQLETANPKAYEFYLKGSNASFNTEFDSSIEYFQKAIEIDPNFVPALEGLATNFLQKGSIGGCGAPCYKKSIEYFEKVIHLAPRHERVQLNLALSYVDSNQIDKAIPLIKGVMARNPENKHAFFCLSYAYRYAGMLEEAAKFLEHSKSTDNKDTSFADIPISYLYQQEYEKFLNELNIPANNSYGLFYRGLANYYLKNFEIAKKQFDDAYRMSPKTLTERIGKVYSLHLEKNDDEAIKFANEIRNEIIKNQVNDGEMIYKIAQGLAELKQTKESLELFDLSVEKGFFCYPFFQNDRLMDNVRQNPQFDKTLKKAQIRHEDFINKFMNDNQALLNLKENKIFF